MSELEQSLGQVLANPQLIQQLMSLVAQLEPPPPEAQSPSSGPDAAAIRQLTAMASSAAVDNRERALLDALGAYVSRERIGKLERAMKAARLASFATNLLQAGR